MYGRVDPFFFTKRSFHSWCELGSLGGILCQNHGIKDFYIIYMTTVPIHLQLAFDDEVLAQYGLSAADYKAGDFYGNRDELFCVAQL